MACSGCKFGEESLLNVLVISGLVLLTPGLLVPKPLLPALVEGLGLVHAVPVSTVPVAAEVAIFVSEVATVTASPLLEPSRMPSVASTVHVASSVHRSASVHGSPAVHGSSSGTHPAPHGSAPG